MYSCNSFHCAIKNYRFPNITLEFNRKVLKSYQVRSQNFNFSWICKCLSLLKNNIYCSPRNDRLILIIFRENMYQIPILNNHDLIVAISSYRAIYSIKELLHLLIRTSTFAGDNNFTSTFSRCTL